MISYLQLSISRKRELPDVNTGKFTRHPVYSLFYFKRAERNGWINKQISSKKPKIWNYEFSFYDENNKEIYVNAQKWEYVLLKYPDQTYDIYLKGPDYLHNEKDIQAASELLLIGVLGEKDFIDYISNIEVVKEFDSNLVGKKTNIKLLKNI